MPAISKTNPINWGAPINSGLTSWWACLGDGFSNGMGLKNLTGRYPMIHNDTAMNTASGRGVYKNAVRFATASPATENASSQAGIPGEVLSSRFTIAVDLMGFSACGTDAAGNGKTCYPVNLGPTHENAGITWYHSNASYNGAFYMKGSGGYPAVAFSKPAAYARAHICATWNGTTMEVFVNGRSSGTNSNSTFGTVHDALRIGNFSNLYNSFPGVIYSVKLLSRAWSVSEVNRDYTESRTGYTTALNRVPSKVYYYNPPVTFKSAWARGSNVILQPGVLA